MIRYQLSLEVAGQWILVGSLSGPTEESVCFSYDESFLEDNRRVPISISLPLQQEAFSPQETRAFFEGLLPEGFTRRAVAAWMGTREEDYLSILYGLGRECLGALRVKLEEEEMEADYRPLSLEDVAALAAEGATKSAELLTQTHLSLTGASGKAGLYYHAPLKQWFLPLGTAPSTHIVKQSHIRMQDMVANEQLSQLCAHYLGIETPESFIVNTGQGREDQILFATKRYDRVFSESAAFIQGLPRPLRLHQEDFAQAMGIPSSEKYERESDQAYLGKMFDLLRRWSSEPVTDTLALWDRIVFAWILGNTDAHLKNYSLLYSADMTKLKLAPAYDLVCTCIYAGSTRKMAFSLGGEYDVRRITKEHFQLAAQDAGISWSVARERLEMLQEGFPAAMNRAGEELSTQGFTRAEEIAESILHWRRREG